MKKVSIIIPVYNVENYLAKCLESLINQSLQDVEFICINDGSTDNSPEILNHYAAKDKRFIILSQDNQGQGVARNNGLEIAQGEYIGFVDPDDWAEPEMFETLYDKAKSLDLDIIECNYYNNFEESGLCREWKTKHPTNGVFNWKNMPAYLFTDPTAVWNKLFKTELIKKHNIHFSNGKYGEDQIFTITARLFAQRALWLGDCLYHYLTRKTSCVHSSPHLAFDMAYFVKDIKNLLINTNSYSSVIKEFCTYSSRYLAHHYRQISSEKQGKFKDFIKTYLSDKEYKHFLKRLNNPNDLSFMEKVFSVKNEYKEGEKIKVITICGNKFRRAI